MFKSISSEKEVVVIKKKLKNKEKKEKDWDRVGSNVYPGNYPEVEMRWKAWGLGRKERSHSLRKGNQRNLNNSQMPEKTADLAPNLDQHEETILVLLRLLPLRGPVQLGSERSSPDPTSNMKSLSDTRFHHLFNVMSNWPSCVLGPETYEEKLAKQGGAPWVSWILVRIHPQHQREQSIHVGRRQPWGFCRRVSVQASQRPP